MGFSPATVSIITQSPDLPLLYMSFTSFHNWLRTYFRGILAQNEPQDTFFLSYTFYIGVWSQGCTPDSKILLQLRLGCWIRWNRTSYSELFINYCEQDILSVWVQLQAVLKHIFSHHLAPISVRKLGRVRVPLRDFPTTNSLKRFVPLLKWFRKCPSEEGHLTMISYVCVRRLIQRYASFTAFS